MKNYNNRILKSYNWEHPFQLTLRAYDLRPLSEKRYAVVLAHNSAQHAWNHLITIWEMINEEMLNDLSSSIKLITEELKIEKIENYLKSTETTKRLRYTQVHVTSFYIYARIFIDRSAAIYPILTSRYKMPERKMNSFPGQYHWLKNNKSEEDRPYFQIIEKHYDKLDEYVINPRNKLISHPVCITEQFRMGGGKTPKIRYEIFSLKDEIFLIKLLEKYSGLIGDKIADPKQNVPNTIKMLAEHVDKLDPNDFTKLMRIKNGMIKELPPIEEAMEQVDSLRSDLDKFYSTLIDEGMLTSCNF